MRLLLELKRRGTIAAVADALHFSPSGVSQQLILLENEVGVKLLERIGRGVRLTEAAEVLADYAERILTELEQAETEVRAVEGQVRGTVRIASFQTAGLALITHMLDVLAHESLLRIELTQAEPERALPALLAREFDLMIGEEYPGVPQSVSRDVHRVDLCEDAMRLALPRELPAVSAESPSDDESAGIRHAADVPWVMEAPGSLSRTWATALCRAAGFEPNVQFESEDMLLHRELAQRGHAAAFVPAMLNTAVAGGPVTYPTGQSRAVFTAVRYGSESHPALMAVRAALADAAQHL